jgi:hypothetical protein
MKIHTAVVHYSATYPDADYTWEQLTRDHLARGFREAGYHWYIRRDGTLIEGRPEGTLGAHVRGYNNNTIGICWEGGLERETGPNVGVWNPTEAQEATLIQLLHNIQKRHPSCKNVVGHIDVGPSQCPGLPKGGVEKWWKEKGGKAPTLAKSRTIQGSGVAAASTVGAVATETAQEIMPLLPYADSLKYVFVVLTLIGVGYAMYARIDDHKKGRK